MSAFSDNGDNPQKTATETSSFVEQLVGEGKKFKDVEELAKGKLEADRYIEQIKAEAQASTESLNSKLEELISRLSEQNKNTSRGSEGSDTDGNTNTDTKTQTKSPMDAESVEALVQEAMKKSQTEATRKANLAKVEQELENTFGERSNEVVNAKAKELGMTVKDLQAFAEKSPNGFLELVGTSRQTSGSGGLASSVTSHSSTVSSKSPLPENERWSHFKELKEKNPKQFYLSFSKMQEAIQKHGSDVFYKS